MNLKQAISDAVYSPQIVEGELVFKGKVNSYKISKQRLLTFFNKPYTFASYKAAALPWIEQYLQSKGDVKYNKSILVSCLVKLWKEEVIEVSKKVKEASKSNTDSSKKEHSNQHRYITIEDILSALVSKVKSSNGSDHLEFCNTVLSLISKNNLRYSDVKASKKWTENGSWGTKLDITLSYSIVPANEKVDVRKYNDLSTSTYSEPIYKTFEEPFLFINRHSFRYNGGTGTVDTKNASIDQKDWKEFAENYIDAYVSNLLSKIKERSDLDKLAEEQSNYPKWYIDYVGSDGDVAHEWVRAKDKEEARNEFLSEHYNSEIIQITKA